MTHQVTIQGWHYDSSAETYTMGNILIKRTPKRATAYMLRPKRSVQISQIKPKTPGDFVDWLDKMTEYVTCLESAQTL